MYRLYIFLPCEHVGATPGLPTPRFAPSLSGGLLGHPLAWQGARCAVEKVQASGGTVVCISCSTSIWPLYRLTFSPARPRPLSRLETSMLTTAWQTTPDMNQPHITELSLFSVVFRPSPCPLVIFCNVHRLRSSQLFAPSHLCFLLFAEVFSALLPVPRWDLACLPPRSVCFTVVPEA